MKNDGQHFLEELASSPTDTFEKSFSVASKGLGLGTFLDRNDLTLLCEAALQAALCNLALNGFEDSGIKPEQEPRRSVSREASAAQN